MRSYTDYCARGRAQHGDKFSEATLAPQFTPFYISQTRIKVRLSCGWEITGTVGATTGWLPVFLLMRRANSHGSMWCLSDKDTIVAVKVGRKYVATV